MLRAAIHVREKVIAMRRSLVGAAALLFLNLVVPFVGVRADMAFADPGFQTQWNRDEAAAPGYWGQAITGGLIEPYTSAAGGIRLVQYYDKGRLEMASGEVTNTALVLDMYRGRIEIGHFQYDKRPPPAVPIAGDTDGPNLTYATLAAVLPETPEGSPKQMGMSVTTRVSPSGIVSVGPPAPATGPESTSDYDFSHNVLQAFADYRRQFTGQGASSKVGFPITEPFRTLVTTGGTAHDVIMQAFWQRVLIYDPNGPDGAKVTAANTGQAYYAWRYANGAMPQPATGPLPIVVLSDDQPGMVTLAAGGTTQTGKNGYAAWCQTDANGRFTRMSIADTFNFIAIPSDVLPVAQGTPLSFMYLGADPLREIGATFYPRASAGTPDKYGLLMLPRGNTGVDAPVLRTGSQATIGASAPPGEYIVLVRILPDGPYNRDCSAEFQFHVQVQ
jgi:hypothetical protein